MHPVLLRLGDHAVVHSYGVMILLALAAGTCAILLVTRSDAARTEHALMVTVIAAGVGMPAARLAFIAEWWREYFIDHPFDESAGLPSVLVIWKGGLVIWGPLLAWAAALALYARARRFSLDEALCVGDAAIVAVPLAQAIGRLGCLLAGCDWGIAADVPFALRFPREALAYSGILSSADTDAPTLDAMRATGLTPPLFPLQLVDAAAHFALFAVVVALAVRGKSKPGRALVVYGCAQPLLALAAMPLRGDHRSTMFNVVCALLMLACTIAVAVVVARARTKPQP
jgi:prolipoprotein diacylglyceryltransferase